MLLDPLFLWIHGMGKGASVRLGWPEFEALDAALKGQRLVQNELLELIRFRLVSAPSHDFMCGIKQELKGRHALLAVDDLVSCHIAVRWCLRLVNDRTEEVIRNGGFPPSRR